MMLYGWTVFFCNLTTKYVVGFEIKCVEPYKYCIVLKKKKKKKKNPITIISGKFCTCIPAPGNGRTRWVMHVNFIISMVQHNKPI